jgi:hypothetical protein
VFQTARPFCRKPACFPDRETRHSTAGKASITRLKQPCFAVTPGTLAIATSINGYAQAGGGISAARFLLASAARISIYIIDEAFRIHMIHIVGRKQHISKNTQVY